MMYRWFMRSVLAGAIGVAVSVSAARAQAPQACPPAATEQMPDSAATLQPMPAQRRIWLPGTYTVRWVKRQNWLCCQANHNTLGCGSLKSEVQFIFGSCRTFFGEPCFKNQPPLPPLGPVINGPPGPGIGGPPAAQAGCRCP